jgi:hypothetical protein
MITYSKGTMRGQQGAGLRSVSGRANHAAISKGILLLGFKFSALSQATGKNSLLGTVGKLNEIRSDVSRLAGQTHSQIGKIVKNSQHFPASREFRLAKAGVPEMFIEISVGTDVAIARGDLDSGSRDLHALIGRDTQTVQDVLASLPKPSSKE